MPLSCGSNHYFHTYQNFVMTFFKSLLFGFILVFCSNILWAQCPQENVFLYSQAQVDSFAVLYPDCTEITDGLWIAGITDLSPLNQITSVGSLSILESPVLTSLSGLDNLTTVVRAVAIRDNDALVDLSGLDNLTTIGEFLHITDNDGLVNLNGLGSLTSISWNLRVGYNDNLLSLSGLNLISIGDDLRIDNNPMLSVCSVPPICSFLENGGIAAIYFNASGCNNLTEVSDACTAIPQVQINAFYDANQNKIQDTDEPNYYDASISIEPGNNSYYVQSDNIFYINPGSYTATFDEAANPNWQLTTDSSSYFLSLEEGEIDTITFGIYPTQQISDIQTIINAPPARCNETIPLDVSAKNLGTTIANGIMWMTIDDAVPTFNFIEQLDTMIANTNTYGWFFSDLYPSQSLEKQVDIQVPGPPDFMLGNSIVFDVYIDFEDENGNQSTPPFVYATQVQCSYDPNDKLVNPNREGDYVLFEEDLIYTIRFQNTGNDVAYDVVIRDTLDTNLDLSTFRFLGTSHPNRLNTILDDEGILTFEFRDIFLPDSTSNFEASQGYVTYRIETIDGLTEETPISNSAGIYFDLNPPVITNTTQSIMVSELPTVSIETPGNSLNFNVLPNPNSGTFTLQGIPEGTYQILNTSGQIVRQGDMRNDLLIDISREAQGVYFISVTVDDATLVRQVVKM